MRFSICYVSTASPTLDESELKGILDHTVKNNNEIQISGILLFSNGNFLQVLEGEKSAIDRLYEKIETDPRHYDIIRIFHKEVEEPQFKDYTSSFISVDTQMKSAALGSYLNQVEYLNPQVRSSVTYVLENFSRGI